MGDLGKFIVAKGFKKLQTNAQSGHTGDDPHLLLEPEERGGGDLT